ncbi:MAG: endonuclease/exonuclease/phosphatase family protein [Hyphomicrobiaceae bacterium]
MLRRLVRSIVGFVLAERGRGLATLLAWITLVVGGAVLWMTVLRHIWPVLDIAAPLARHAFAASLIAGVTLLLQRGRLMFLGGALGGVLVTPSLMTLDAREQPGVTRLNWQAVNGVPGARERDGARVLRVLAINTFHNNDRTDALLAYVSRADADVVVLSEFGPEKVELLDRLRRAYPFQVSCAHEWACSQVLLSRHPFNRSGTVMPGLSSPPLVWAEFRTSDGEDGGVAGPMVTVVGTHIYRPSRRHDWHRAQLEGLAQRLRSLDGAVIVAGDFNMTRLSASYTEFLEGSGLIAPQRELASWPAWPPAMPLPQVQIDHLFTSPDIEVLEQRIGTPVGSDHLPLWSALRLPKTTTVMADRPSAGAVPKVH